MAVDSIMARPTKRVRLIVFDSSGCWAMAWSAWATARPSPRAGPTEPMAIARAALAIEMNAVRLVGSTLVLLRVVHGVTVPGRSCGLLLLPIGGGGRRDVDHGEHGEDVGLDQAREEAESAHDDGKDERRDADEDRHDDGAAHDVAVEADSEGESARELPDQVEGEHEGSRSDVVSEVLEDALLRDAEEGDRDEDAEREGGRRGERARRGHPAREDHQQIGGRDEQEEGSDEGQVDARVLSAHLADLVAHARDEHLQQVLPAGHPGPGREVPCDRRGDDDEQEHHEPAEPDRGIQLHDPPAEEDDLVGADGHGAVSEEGGDEAMRRGAGAASGLRRRARAVVRKTRKPSRAHRIAGPSPAPTAQSATETIPIRAMAASPVPSPGFRRETRLRTDLRRARR